MLRSKGPLLTIDTASQSGENRDIDDVLSAFVGGRGVCVNLAHSRIPFDVDPLGADNRLYLAAGQLQQSTMSYRPNKRNPRIPAHDGPYVVECRRLPLAKFHRDRLLSRRNHRMKRGSVGYPHLGYGRRIRSGTRPRGANGTGRNVRRGRIRPVQGKHHRHRTAGENLVRFASIMTSEYRAFGRGGMGTVLGSKNVKFVTFEGASASDVNVLEVVLTEIHRDAATDDHIMKPQGTPSVADLAHELDGMPTRYFSERQFEGIQLINGDAVEEKKYKKGTGSKRAFAYKLPTKAEERGVGIAEVETVMAFGSNCAVHDVVDVMKSNDLCDELGLGTISCGDVVAAYLASQDAFGDAETVHKTVRKIPHREGIGDTLAEGIGRCHDEFGVEDWTVKNLEFAAHEGRPFHGQALSYATSKHGADHNYAAFFVRECSLVPNEQALPPEGFNGKSAEAIKHETIRVFMDSAIVLQFSHHQMTPERYEALFGTPYDDLLTIGAKVVELEREFNSRRGSDRETDTLPYDIEDFKEAFEEYYDLRGRNQDGTVPEGGAVTSA